jgi:NAD(P)-dependent dehydrogenase (short-subunit alcohol dehydrogenase family)
MELTTRSALVTGASRGIGRAIAAALSGAGARVYLVARGARDLEATADAINSGTRSADPSGGGAGGRAVPVACDVTDADAVAAMTEFVADATGGAPDILVNNAGLFPLAPLDLMAPDDFARTLDVNLVAPFRLLRAFLPAMKRRGTGHVVTIGSVADRTIFAGNGAYSASKFGKRAMQEVLREELRGGGVRSTLISPAATDTPIWDPIDPDNNPGFPPRAAMLRPEDVADAVLWAVTRPAGVNVDELRLSAT